jgi:hypothetical protein
VPVGTKVVVLQGADMVPVAALPGGPSGDPLLTAPTASILPTYGHAG